jgi:hypothetical protein
MDLTPYLDDLRTQLATAAEPAGPEARALAERLTAALESSYRLALLDALSVAAAEITSELAPGSVEVRLRGRDPEFVVALPAPVEPAPVAPAPVHVPDDDAAMTRINLRLDQVLKDRVEDAAKASGLSVNAWLVRAASAALVPGTTSRTTPRGGESYRGWVR